MEIIKSMGTPPYYVRTPPYLHAITGEPLRGDVEIRQPALRGGEPWMTFDEAFKRLCDCSDYANYSKWQIVDSSGNVIVDTGRQEDAQIIKLADKVTLTNITFVEP